MSKADVAEVDEYVVVLRKIELEECLCDVSLVVVVRWQIVKAELVEYLCDVLLVVDVRWQIVGIVRDGVEWTDGEVLASGDNACLFLFDDCNELFAVAVSKAGGLSTVLLRS